MAASYSTDLRIRVLAEYNKGILKKKEIAQLFQIDVKTVYNWARQQSVTGEIKPKIGYQKGHSHKITDLKKFKEFIVSNPNLSLKELGLKWDNVSRETIRRGLRKINYTFKKNNLVIKKEMTQDEQNI